MFRRPFLLIFRELIKIKETGIYKIYSVIISSIFCNFLGGFDVFLKSLFILSFLDIITGVLNMIFMKNLSSNMMFQSFAKKICIYSLIAVSVSIDSVLNTGSSLRGASIGFFIGTEALSILENCTSIGLPLPKKLINIISQFKETEKK